MLHLDPNQLRSVSAGWQDIATELRLTLTPPNSQGDWPSHQAAAGMHTAVQFTGQGLSERVGDSSDILLSNVTAFEQQDNDGTSAMNSANAMLGGISASAPHLAGG